MRQHHLVEEGAFTFKRRGDGSVLVFCGEESIVIHPEQWCVLVANMTRGGEWGLGRTGNRTSHKVALLHDDAPRAL